MNIIIALISVSITIATGFLASFLWSLRSGQFDDTYSPSVRMLFDEKLPGTGIAKEDSRKHVEKTDKNQPLS